MIGRASIGIVISLATAPGAAWGQGPLIAMDDDVAEREFVITVGPLDLPGSHGMDHGHAGAVSPRPQIVTIPRDASLYGFSFEVVDRVGEPLPSAMLHHMNLVDPDHRELFLPIARRMLAVGQDTPASTLPRRLFGYPVAAGQRVAVSATVHNLSHEAMHGVSVRVRLEYMPRKRVWPLFDLVPFHVDVAFPDNKRDFDVPPGTSRVSWEGSPATTGRLMALGAHMHDYATRIVFEDMTRGKIIWDARPVLTEDGHLDRAPLARLYRRLGVKVRPDRTYRVTVTYHNPTEAPIPSGGMGVVAGVFISSSERALLADTTNVLYQSDWLHYMQLDKAPAGMPSMSHTSMRASAPSR